MKTKTYEGWIGKADLRRWEENGVFCIDFIRPNSYEFKHVVDIPPQQIIVDIVVTTPKTAEPGFWEWLMRPLRKGLKPNTSRKI